MREGGGLIRSARGKQIAARIRLCIRNIGAMFSVACSALGSVFLSASGEISFFAEIIFIAGNLSLSLSLSLSLLREHAFAGFAQRGIAFCESCRFITRCRTRVDYTRLNIAACDTVQRRDLPPATGNTRPNYFDRRAKRVEGEKEEERRCARAMRGRFPFRFPFFSAAVCAASATTTALLFRLQLFLTTPLRERRTSPTCARGARESDME